MMSNSTSSGLIYDQYYNSSFHQKLESMQYNAAPAITGAIRGSSRENFIKNKVWNP